ncbi:MAG: hypothetical protein ABIN18_21225 [Pseudomonadota bacterium]
MTNGSGTVSLPPCLRGLSISNTKAFNPSTIYQSYGAGGAGKSIVCQEDRYLLELVCYIQLNPMRAVIKGLGGYFDLDSKILILPGMGRKVSRARSIFCVQAIDLFGYSGAEVARALSLTPSAVSKPVVKGREDELASVIESYLMTLLERQT